MSEKTASVDVRVPVRTAYDQWTQFEQFPQFMEGVESVVQVDDRHLHWVAKIGGVEREWDAEIVEQIPDERIAWRSTTGSANAGVVTFHPLATGETRVKLQLEMDPEGFAENVGDKLGFVSRQAQNDLERFRDLIEERGIESGAWRGEVQGGREVPRTEP